MKLGLVSWIIIIAFLLFMMWLFVNAKEMKRQSICAIRGFNEYNGTHCIDYDGKYYLVEDAKADNIMGVNCNRTKYCRGK